MSQGKAIPYFACEGQSHECFHVLEKRARIKTAQDGERRKIVDENGYHVAYVARDAYGRVMTMLSFHGARQEALHVIMTGTKF